MQSLQPIIKAIKTILLIFSFLWILKVKLIAQPVPKVQKNLSCDRPLCTNVPKNPKKGC